MLLKKNQRFDTKLEFKFIKSFQATNIFFMGSRPTHMMLDNVVSSSKLSSMPDDDLHSMSAFDTIKFGDDTDDDMADSKHISKEDTIDPFQNASTKFHSLSCHLDHVCEEVSNLHSKIADMPSSGTKLLGGAVSRDANLISGLAMRRAMNAVDLMTLLPHLHDP
ncbi:hypothetical protein Tco_0870331 [Tanacetum coccineum]